MHRADLLRRLGTTSRANSRSQVHRVGSHWPSAWPDAAVDLPLPRAQGAAERISRAIREVRASMGAGFLYRCSADADDGGAAVRAQYVEYRHATTERVGSRVTRACVLPGFRRRGIGPTPSSGISRTSQRRARPADAARVARRSLRAALVSMTAGHRQACGAAPAGRPARRDAEEAKACAMPHRIGQRDARAYAADSLPPTVRPAREGASRRAQRATTAGRLAAKAAMCSPVRGGRALRGARPSLPWRRAILALGPACPALTA